MVVVVAVRLRRLPGYMPGYNASNLNRVAAGSATNSAGGQGGKFGRGRGPDCRRQQQRYVMTGKRHFDGQQLGESFVIAGRRQPYRNRITSPEHFAPHQFDTDLGSRAYAHPGTTMSSAAQAGDGVPAQHGEQWAMRTAPIRLFRNPGTFPSTETPATFTASVYYNPPSGSMCTSGARTTPASLPVQRHDVQLKRRRRRHHARPVSNAGHARCFLSLSANGTSNGIIWALTPYDGNANNATVAGILHAFDAQKFSADATELWKASRRGRDNFGNYAKFTYPTVVNGKVYVPTFGNAPRSAPLDLRQCQWWNVWPGPDRLAAARDRHLDADTDLSTPVPRSAHSDHRHLGVQSGTAGCSIRR